MTEQTQKEKKLLYKKWYFGIILIAICVLLYIFISKHIENKKTEKSFESMGKGANNFVTGISTAKSHIDEFNYNIQTGEVEYKPSKITLEMYNRIKEEMTQEEVISILGNYDEILYGENTYLVQWGDSNMSKGYWISIVFDINNKNVVSYSQVGLK